jgi:hypothetical protein
MMAWLSICLPLMIIGIAIATIPLIYAIHHQHRYGLESKPRPNTQHNIAVREGQNGAGLLICPECSAFIMDREIHSGAVHQPVIA